MLKLMRLFFNLCYSYCISRHYSRFHRWHQLFAAKSAAIPQQNPRVTCGFFCGSCCVSVVKIHNKSARSLTCSRFQFFCVDLFFCYMLIGFSKTHPHILHCNLVHICTRKSRQQICNV